MRVSTAWVSQQSLLQMQRQQTDVNRTQNQLASNQKWTSAADDPAGHAAAQNLDRLIAQNQQYTAAAQSAQQRLQTGEDALASAIGLMQHAGELVVRANSAANSAQGRAAIAQELSGLREQLLALANTGDGQGQYLFGGSDTGQPPFAWDGGNARYQGDQTIVRAQIGSERYVEQNDDGERIFMNLPTGNGRFSVQSASGNAGSLSVGSSAAGEDWDGGSYTLSFDGSGGYQVRDAANAVVGSGSYSASSGDGATISFRGASLSLSGTPAAGDSLQLQPSGGQDMFALIDKLAALIKAPQDSASQRAATQTQLQQGMVELQTAQQRLSEVRAGYGLRLNMVDDAIELAAAQGEHATQAVSSLRDLDYAEAITRLQLQMTTLQAAQQTFVKVQGLSLFDYLR